MTLESGTKVVVHSDLSSFNGVHGVVVDNPAGFEWIPKDWSVVDLTRGMGLDPDEDDMAIPFQETELEVQGA